MPAPSAPLPPPGTEVLNPGTPSSVLLLRHSPGAPEPSLGVPFCSLPLPVALALVVM